MIFRRITAGFLLFIFPSVAWAQTITGFTPASGKPGNIITINGSGLGAVTRVVFNNSQPILADFTNVSGSQLLVAVPEGATSGPLEVFVGSAGVSTTTNFLIAPVISNFFPQTGASPTVISILGENFVSNGTTVTFPGVSTKINAHYIAPGEISAQVPVGAGDGPITVMTSAGTDVSTNTFLASDVPSISSFTPTVGAAGTMVTIFGGNFFSGATVRFGSVASGSTTINSTTEITATVPAGAVTGAITVSTSDGNATTTSNFLTGSGPIITGFSPTIGGLNSYVSINGLNLSTSEAVTFNGVSETITSSSGDTNLQVDLVHVAGTGPIKLTLGAATFTTSTNFTNTTAPFVTDFNPVAGPAGTIVTIDGQNFPSTPTVKFGSTIASSRLTGETQIEATVPSVAAGNYAIEVTGSSGSYITSSNFLVTGAGPVIASFTPTNGVRGTTVTLTGANFSSLTSVKFNGVSAGFQSASTTELTATVPADATSGPITVTGSGLTGTSPSLYYLQPWITSLSTNGGTVNSTFTINGRSLTNTSAVQVNGINYNFTSSASQIIATIPSNAISGQLEITAPGGVFIDNSSFAILPKIYSFSPMIGPAGTVIVINGTSLFDVTSVAFNGAAVSPSSVTSNQVQITVPNNAGNGPLTVVTPYGNSTSTNSFTVTKPSLVVLTKTAIPSVVSPGSNMTYRLLVTNEGPSLITSASVTDTLPGRFVLVSATPTIGTWTNINGTLTWSIGFLSNNASASFDILGTAQEATGLTNSAVLSFAEGNLATYDNYSSIISFFVYDAQRTLSIKSQANPPEVIITWPQSPANFSLQINTNANLNIGWAAPTNAVFLSNSLNTFTDSITAPQTFFRLMPP